MRRSLSLRVALARACAIKVGRGKEAMRCRVAVARACELDCGAGLRSTEAGLRAAAACACKRAAGRGCAAIFAVARRSCLRLQAGGGAGLRGLVCEVSSRLRASITQTKVEEAARQWVAWGLAAGGANRGGHSSQKANEPGGRHPLLRQICHLLKYCVQTVGPALLARAKMPVMLARHAKQCASG